ncbi:MAG: glycosyltransferase family 2 protein [Actinomycetota bacterium]|jgi:N-acetylglucosaminyl-diphospho-decaprenol L-rhamnosyltransferase|nr:glycosyltransferase family 2 protein [Actinomycetota bacterium]
MNVAGVVVNYNARDYLLRCVESLLSEGVEGVVVVDNGSSDGSEAALAEAFPEAKWASTGSNIGYGAAANHGAAVVSSDYLLVCNADIVLGEGAVAALVELLERRPEVAVVGPLIVDATGRLYPSARRFPDLLEAFGHGIVGQFWPGNPFSRRYTMAEWDHAGARLVDWVSGSCFLARREAWEAVGGFDSSYFMYMEDVDLCWRLRQAGWEVAYEPGARVTHVQGVSADRHPYRMLLAHHVSMWRFAWRTTEGRARWLLALVLPGLGARLALTALRRWLAGARAAAAGGTRLQAGTRATVPGGVRSQAGRQSG